MTATDASPALPRGFAREAAIYLRPVGLFDSAPPDAMPLAGGPLAFAACEVVVRDGDRVLRATASNEAVAAWAAALPTQQGARVTATLARLAAPRAAIAGLSLDRPRLMGVVNVTPDSFSDGGDHADAASAAAHGRALMAEGADILDIGGESTRPGARAIPVDEELRRVLPVLDALAGQGVMSVDTRRAPVMRAAIDHGAAMVNDITALTADGDSMAAAAAAEAVVLMHSQGDPGVMQEAPVYRCAPLDIYDALEARIEACAAAGIGRRRLIVDPGIGFGKTLAHNLEILRDLALFHGLGCALMIGVSRKSLFGDLGVGATPKARLAGSLSGALAALARGAHILRVHDVARTREAVTVWRAIGQ